VAMIVMMIMVTTAEEVDIIEAFGKNKKLIIKLFAICLLNKLFVD
jgi:hypothetical protein